MSTRQTGNAAPRVSIGMPVFNGERHIAEAIDSILGQTFEGFELVISDNASTDGTRGICEEYASRDPRIRYHRNAENVGATKNFNQVFDMTSGEYFKWAAHDDVCAPELLAECVSALDGDPSVVLAYSSTRVIDENSRTMQNYRHKLNTASPHAYVRFRDLIWVRHHCYQVWGLSRSAALERTSLIGDFWAGDRTLLAQLALLGRFYEVPGYLFSYRRHAAQSVLSNPTRHLQVIWMDPAYQGRIVFPYWRIFAEYFKTVSRSSLDGRQKLRCYTGLARWLPKNWKYLVKDLAVVAQCFMSLVPGPGGATKRA